MKRQLAVLAGLTVACALAGPVEAQSANPLSVEFAGIYATLSGDDFEGTDAGMGFDAQLRYTTGSQFTVGGGVQRTTHGIDGFDNNLAVLGFFVEPRMNIKMSGTSNLAPFLALRAAYLKESLSEGGSDLSASGYLIGFGGGLSMSASPSMSLTGTVTYNIVNFGEAEVDGTSIPDSDAGGSSLALRFGVNWRF